MEMSEQQKDEAVYKLNISMRRGQVCEVIEILIKEN